MKYIKTYNEHNDILVLENFNIKNMLKKIKESKNKKKIAKSIIIMLLSVYSITQINSFIEKQDLDNKSKNILLDELESKKINKLMFDKISKSKSDSLLKYKSPTKMILSQDGWDQLRIEEGSIFHKGEPVLKAYKIGDGMITIGYGHAEMISNSTYNVDDTITKEEANKLFIIDVNKAASGVKRMFEQWKKEGIDIRLTQSQYDVCVSIAFNKGVAGFRKSSFVQEIKKGDMIAAAEKIKQEGINSKYKGLRKRRLRESEKFLA